MSLPEAFLARPFAHRGLHGPGAPENTRAACAAAVAAGFGIEIDLQLSRDGEAMVFHDDTLDRLTGATGCVRAHSAAQLGALHILDSLETVPTLSEVLRLVAGRVPLLIEIKDQDGTLGGNVGALEAATVAALDGYAGPHAVMSFNPHAVARVAELGPGTLRGLTTSAFTEEDWPEVPAARRAALAQIPDYDRVGACFISHDRADLDAPAVAALKIRGASVLTWTIRSAEEETIARKIADAVTFEGFRPAVP